MSRMVDVAKEAGVSVATVSRVLNGIGVRPELELAVRAAVAKLDYAPDKTARSLRRRNSELWGLILADIGNPFFTAVARSVEDYAHRHGYSVVICNTDEDPTKESRYLRVVSEQRMSGLIICPTSRSTDVRGVIGTSTAVVVIDRSLDTDLDHVVFDNRAAGESATDVLLQAGYQRIACITGPRATTTAAERAQGWEDAYRKAGLVADPALAQFVEFDVEGGIHAMRTLMASANPPDAVVATNNLVGVGALRTVSDLDRHDIGVSVIGDLPFATSVSENVWIKQLKPSRLGKQAAKMLIERLDGVESGPGRHVVLPIGAPKPQRPL